MEDVKFAVKGDHNFISKGLEDIKDVVVQKLTNKNEALLRLV